MMAKFPTSFLWGAATASYQVEGGIENNDWAEAAREGRVPICGVATDHYHKYEADFDIVKSLGHSVHRLSIEWARIEPEEGRFNDKEIEHYRKVLRALKERGIEPMVTLWHFTLPLWFSRKGGFENKSAHKIFARYCEYVVSKLKDESKFWITINEPLVWASGGYRTGKWPPFKKNFYKFLIVQSALVRAHKLAFSKIKKINPSLQIGIAKNNICFHSSVWWGKIPEVFMKWFWNDRFLNKIRSHQDFIGLNHYFYKNFGLKTKLPKSDMGWDIFPEAIYWVLLGLRKYSRPIYITENGIADSNDSKRSDFIRGYLAFIEKAINHGVSVKGYMYWSLLDNYEWAYGFNARFGLVEVNYSTLERKIRESAFIYRDIIQNKVS